LSAFLLAFQFHPGNGAYLSLNAAFISGLSTGVPRPARSSPLPRLLPGLLSFSLRRSWTHMRPTWRCSRRSGTCPSLSWLSA
jgi:hypothetical protein